MAALRGRPAETAEAAQPAQAAEPAQAAPPAEEAQPEQPAGGGASPRRRFFRRFFG